jgi:hypothetical protein
LQKRASGGLTDPQLAQTRASGWPQFWQNRALAALGVWQFGQIIAA